MLASSKKLSRMSMLQTGSLQGEGEGSCAHTEVVYTETATTAASIIETTKPRFTV